MKIHKSAQPELVAASPKAKRPAIQEPYLEIQEGVGTLVATDGRMLVALPVTLDEGDVAGYVSGEALKMARKGVSPLRLDLSSETIVNLPSGATLPRKGQAEGEPPAHRNVYPGRSEPSGVPAIPGHYRKVAALNAEFLAKLVRAMGASECEIWAHPESLGAYVINPRTPEVAGARGLLAPVQTQ